MGEGKPGSGGGGGARGRGELTVADAGHDWQVPSVTIEDLERWEDNGAVWRPYEVTDTRAVIDLCSCTGEPMERVQSDAEEVIELARSRAHVHLDRPSDKEHHVDIAPGLQRQDH